MNLEQTQAIELVASKLAACRRLGVITGAGMSQASGLPTYRGIGGLYNDIEVEAGMPIEEILHAYTMARDPALTWKYIAQIESGCRGAEPNAGHDILARWEERFDVCVVTQNIDGFHSRAGSKDVIELHGNLARLYCLDCDERYTIDQISLAQLPPRCQACDGLVRPNVVLFGEMLPPDALQRYEQQLLRGFDVLLCIGTTAGFPYIQDPVITASRQGITTVEINPDQTVLSSVVSARIDLAADVALQAIDKSLRSMQ